jgi:hypothetical protein
MKKEEIRQPLIIPQERAARFRAAALLLCWMFILPASGCIKKESVSIPTEYGSRIEHTFGSTIDDTWKAVIMALSEKDIIKIMDRPSGVVITEFGSVDAADVTTLHTYMKGQRYKYVYTINFSEQPDDRTAVRIDVKLHEPALTFLNENTEPLVQNYLRADLFQRICSNLAPNRADCDVFISEPTAVTAADGQSSAGEKKQNIAPLPSPSDSQVMTVQQKLAEAGYDPGPADGLMGAKTTSAIRKYQQEHGLPVTGQISDPLLIALDRVEEKKEAGHLQETAAQESFISPPVPATPPPPVDEVMDIAENEKLPVEKRGIIAEETEMKSQADPFSETIVLISGGSQVEIIENSSSWARVKFSGHEGYVLYDLVRPLANDTL